MFISCLNSGTLSVCHPRTHNYLHIYIGTASDTIYIDVYPYELYLNHLWQVLDQWVNKPAWDPPKYELPSGIASLLPRYGKLSDRKIQFHWSTVRGIFWSLVSHVWVHRYPPIIKHGHWKSIMYIATLSHEHFHLVRCFPACHVWLPEGVNPGWLARLQRLIGVDSQVYTKNAINSIQMVWFLITTVGYEL